METSWRSEAETSRTSPGETWAIPVCKQRNHIVNFDPDAMPCLAETIPSKVSVQSPRTKHIVPNRRRSQMRGLTASCQGCGRSSAVQPPCLEAGRSPLERWPVVGGRPARAGRREHVETRISRMAKRCPLEVRVHVFSMDDVFSAIRSTGPEWSRIGPVEGRIRPREVRSPVEREGARYALASEDSSIVSQPLSTVP